MLSLDAVWGSSSDSASLLETLPSAFSLSDEDFAVLQADPVALQAYYAAMVDAGAWKREEKVQNPPSPDIGVCDPGGNLALLP
jgi:hypothetical protein